mgnify:CR=1 FL=1
MKIKMLMAFVALLLFSAFTADHTITIFMIGDSTMANKSLEGGNQERGWGHVLGGYFSENIRVENHARNGRSSKSFIDEGLWEVVINKVKPGDYVFIQFGHNDEKVDEKRHTDPGSTFDANLRRFVKETRAKGGIPVLFNAIVRRNFRNNKNAVAEDDVRKDLSKGSVSQDGEVLIDTHGKYLDSPRNVAKELDVSFVDMNKITHDLVQRMGPEASKKLFMWIPEGVCAACPKGREDNTHLNVYGARTIAGLTVDAIAKEVPVLGPFIRHYDFVVAKDGSGDFFTIQEAIHAVPDFRKAGRTTILVRKGVYKEKVVIPESKISISLIGEDGAILTNDDFASKKNCFGEEMSTSGSSTCYIYAPDFYAENITFENSAGRVGQAVACFVSGDRAYFKNCRFLGNQEKKAVPLMIGGSFHTPYMEEARLELKKHIDETIFNSPVIPVCQCVDGELNLDPEKIKNNLIEHITHPVLWTHMVHNMVSSGVDKFYEVGPDDTLQKIVTRMYPEKKITTIWSIPIYKQYNPLNNI